MSVLKFYSNSVSVKQVSQGHEDEDGNYIPGEESEWVKIDGCDIVPAAGGIGEIQFLDGVVHKYQYTIYLPSDCMELKFGDEIILERYGETIKSTVKGFLRYQHQCKAWA